MVDIERAIPVSTRIILESANPKREEAIMTYRELLEKISRHCHTMERYRMTPEVSFWMKIMDSIGRMGTEILDDEVEEEDYLDRIKNERESIGLEREGVQ